MSKTKRDILAELAKNEASGRERNTRILNCGRDYCPLVPPVKTNFYDLSAIQNSPEFAQTLEDIRENYPGDHLSVGDRIISDFFEQEGVDDKYKISEVDPLEKNGIHITNNPGFSFF